MIESLKNTDMFKTLNLMQNLKHAYLFFSLDKQLNNNVAKLFAKMLLCENNNICNTCSACHQFDSLSHPDLVIIDQNTIKVEDVDNIISKLNTLPISATKKVFVILNAENINEISQNKLLKSLEDPSQSNIFIMSTCKIDKLLPTVLSRLHKVNLPKLSSEDKLKLNSELLTKNVDITKFLNQNLTLTDIVNFETDSNYINTTKAIKYLFFNLKSSKDIPIVVNSLPDYDKNLFFEILQKLFLNCIENKSCFDEELSSFISANYPKQALINSLKHIEMAYKMQMSNVVFSYILDNLLFNILKEKFLCKQ